MISIARVDAADARLEQNLGLAKLVAYLTLADLLLLPYFQLVIMPFSLPLLCLSMMVFNTTLKRDKYLTLFVLLVAAVALSTTTAFVYPGAIDNITENFKRIIQLLTSFIYFFYFRWLSARVPLRATPVVIVFMIWFGALAVAFALAPDVVGGMIRSAYGRLVTSEEVLQEHLRFAYAFTDPNTAGYFLLIAGSVPLMERRSTWLTTLIVLMLAGLTFTTQSRGGLVALVLMVMAMLYPPKRLVSSLLSARRAFTLALLAAVSVGAILYLKATAEQSTGLVKLAYARFFESPESFSSGGSRLEIWQRFTSNLVPLPLGRGYLLKVEGNIQGTHSDLIRIIYSYGIIAVIPVLMFFFCRIMSFTVLIIPALMAFLINSLIDEQKLLALFLALLGICLGTEERRKAAAHLHAS